MTYFHTYINIYKMFHIKPVKYASEVTNGCIFNGLKLPVMI